MTCKALALALTIALAAPLANAQPVGLPSMGSASSADLSPSLEQKLGDAIMEQGRRDPTYINDADVSQYLLELGRRLTQASAGADVTVFGVRDPNINAFALPGGYIGINSGLVVTSDHEDELASVIAHEIGHIYQRHVARGMTQQTQSRNVALASLAGALLAALAGNGNLAMGVASFGQAAAIDQQLGFSRQAEQEADRVGLEMLRRAGFDPEGMVDMFEKLGNASRLNEGAGIGAYTSTHPLTIQRMSDVKNRISNLPGGGNYRPDSNTFWFVRAKLRLLQSRDSLSLRNAEAIFRQETDNKGVKAAAAWYGLALLAQQRGELPNARSALEKAKSQGIAAPQLAELDAQLALDQKDTAQALALSRQAWQRWPENQGLGLVRVQAELRGGQPDQAAQVLNQLIRRWPEEPRFYQLQAQSLEAQGKPVKARLSMATYYEKMGALRTAVEQLQQARGLSKDFYEQSEIDVRIRSLQEEVRLNRELLEQFK